MKITFGSQSFEVNPSGENYVAAMDGKNIPVQIVRADDLHGNIFPIHRRNIILTRRIDLKRL